MKYGRISEVTLYNLSSVVIQCLITFLAMSMSKFHHMTGCVFKWCEGKSNGFECKNKRRLHAFSKEKERCNQGALRRRFTFGASSVQQANNSAIKITLDNTCPWTITCRLTLGLLKERMIKANPKESGIHHLTLIGNMRLYL